ncbi:DUF2628 domain-containing protein [Oharaeibacter diazotrophicus]|uniref:Uncharacterized protein DUF2628 n=2 Tax=Oharaeibacter diazotrophicus TaxID=1920512 RepID=A0A4R6R6B2_9HYPH|nr:DUF2628 domain-containing protein [Oharaeibacter diazotrophicus]TDP81473.1 uncharacterized protein DUF2628 [Oharaeibacter diazotrophicus]BBE73711.1 hypothetical protein OHA_1_03327 [Pleomorphomonas sp. SM30]GLS75500.1 hypothetical protein GCM10007904_08350 [Oharaeibacter diazotrophicus]
MAIYTVHAPPGEDPPASRAEEVRFVREGFSIWALVLPGVWFLWNRMWLVFLGWLAAMVAFEFAGRALPGPYVPLAAALFGLFLALEARDLLRWTLERRGWRLVGVVEGGDRDVAERRFFDALLVDPAAAPASADPAVAPSWDGTDLPYAAPDAPAPKVPVPSRAPRPMPSGVIGLFPSSGGRER